MYKILPILLFAYGLAVTADENYNNSWALVIGISKYKDFADLNYPANDAETISDLINNKFHFPKSNILTLLNEEATKENILSSLSLINSSAGTSDRVIIFYAGQTFSTQNIIEGNTVHQMDYLVPFDGRLHQDIQHISFDQNKLVYQGISSYYGPNFHGKKTANGETFDMYGLTAAHKEFPFNTIIRVTNEENGKSLKVRINDRGPYVDNRILDCSFGVAQKLDFVEKGIAPIKIEVIEWGHGVINALISLEELGDFANLSKARDVLFLLDIACDLSVLGKPHELNMEYIYRGSDGLAGLVAKELAKIPKYSLDAYNQKANQSSRRVISAGKNNDLIIESESLGHSYFSNALIRGLKYEESDLDFNGKITSSELYVYLRNSVLLLSDDWQIPQYFLFPNDQHDFIILNISPNIENNDIITSSYEDMTIVELKEMITKQPSYKDLLVISEILIKRHTQQISNQALLNDKNQEFILDKTKIYDISWAVIIGIDEYKDIPLKYAVRDAQEVNNALLTNFGFKKENIDILINEDATLSNIKKSLINISKSANNNDRILVFYAGHGTTESTFDGSEQNGFLIPYDGKLDNAFATGLDMDFISKLCGRSHAKHMLFLMDACYSGLMAENTRGLTIEKKEGFLTKVINKKGRQIITAGSANESALERDEWQHSAFTINLLDALNNLKADIDGDKFLTTEELGVYLRKSVTESTNGKQTPQVANFKYGEGGEFVFFK